MSECEQEVYRAVYRDLGSVIGHLDICVDRPELFRDNGVHLYELCLEILLQDLQSGLHPEVAGFPLPSVPLTVYLV